MPALKILVINQLAERHLTAIANAAPGSHIVTAELADAQQHVGDADILVGWGHMKLQPLLQQAARLRWIHALSAGVENLLIPEIVTAPILLTNSRGIHGIPMSEHVLAMILAFTRGLTVFARQQQRKEWKRASLEEIHEKTIGIVGLGSIGREIAKRAKTLGMEVIATKREQTAELFVDKLYAPDQLNQLLEVADFVVVTLPLTQETKGLFNLALFKNMKPTAYFINVARGAIVNEADLISALQQGLIRGAALDVFDHEPLPDTSPLWEMPNVLITPHIAAISPHYLDRAIKLFCENLIRFSEQKELLNIIDKQKGY